MTQMRAITKSDWQRFFHQWQEAGISAYKPRTLLRRRQDQIAIKSPLSLTKKSVPELNDQSTY